jgi:sarcosine oxidase, subunit beta
MTTCDVVVIGGGCVGASVAYHLAEAGCTDVVLLEAGVLAGGSTSKAAGGIRMQHGDPLNTRLARRSLDEFTRFADMTGSEIDFKQVGYLFLIDSPADLELFTAAVAMQRDLGIPIEELTRDAAHDLVPQLDVTGLVGATYCPLDGYATPEAVVQGYAAGARRRGVRVRQGTNVSQVVVENGRVVGVDIGDERIATPVVVCAAGTGSAAVAATAGVELPVTGEARRMFFTPHSGGVPDGVPLTVDFASSFYFHREGPGLVFGGREFEPEDLMEPALRRLPVLGDLPIASSWYGDYDMSPDHNGIVGADDSVAGFYYATGFSGHGFMLSPAVGEHLAELITGQSTTIDLSALSARRFADEGSRRREHIVI